MTAGNVRAARVRPVGLLLALFGALLISPDTLFMRWSEMSGFAMVAWRGLLMGVAMLLVWALTSRTRARDLTLLCTGAGLALVVLQAANAMMFATGVAAGPAALILMGVATAPVWAAILSWLWLGERTRPVTWVAIVCVMGGIALAVSGEVSGHGTEFSRLGSIWATIAGLGVGGALAANFVLLRQHGEMPILLCIGLGALLVGITGWFLAGADIATGQIWAIAITGLIILPVSFFVLSLAARHTAAANVGLLMLLETVLGPLWVWLGVGEAPTPRMLAGGAIVVGTLALYILYTARRSQARIPV